MKKVFVAGHDGLAGSALNRIARSKGYTLVNISKKELDLRDPLKTELFIQTEKPHWVIIAAAVVGGIKANSSYPVEFLLDNMKIQNNLIEASFKNNVEKLVFLGSNCMYPKFATQPMREDALLTGPLEPTNEAYGIAKISGVKLCQSYNKQYGTNFFSVVPTTLYGRNDNYHADKAHVLPMLMRRIHEAKLNGDKQLTVWGSGSPKREFLFSDDMATACFHLLEKCKIEDVGELINIGSGEEYSIAELARSLMKVVGLKADLVFDSTKPDGAPRKLLNSERILGLGWKPQTDFESGLQIVYNDFLNNPNVRK